MSANLSPSRSLMGSMALVGSITLLSASIGFCAAAQAAALVLYEADYDSNTINKISLDGNITPVSTILNGTHKPSGLAFDTKGNLFASDYDSQSINKISSDGTATTFVSHIAIPYGLAFDKSGNLYVTDAAEFVGNRDAGIYKPKSGTIRKISKEDGTDSIITSELDFPVWLTFNASGELFESDHEGTTNRINQISLPDGKATLFATGLQGPFQLVFGQDGYLYEADEDSQTINKISPDGTPVTPFVTGVPGPFGLAFDADGNLFASDFINGKINKISTLPDGTKTVTTFVEGLHGPRGLVFGPDTFGSTAVPEPFTIVGTLIGGTAALRMRKKLKDSSKA